MTARLPEDFINRMKGLLGEEAERFLASYAEPRVHGLRVNTLKIPVDGFLSRSPFTLDKIPWAEAGFYYAEGDRPGKHPYYHAGLYYIQEPSAMAPAELLQVEPGDRVLDLCAAPGGKSTQIAAKLQGRGLLVANDIQAERVKALVKNLALLGVRNAVVTNASPEELAGPFRGYFDKILIDAPCSGEGMFRKDEQMAASWQKHSVERCALMQRDILETAAQLLAPGGRIVYSTCTFAPEENEATVARFLDGHPEFAAEPVPMAAVYGFAPGRPDWISGEHWRSGETFSPAALAAVAETVRLWPHRLRGEGHYVAVLRHRGQGGRDARPHGEEAAVSISAGDGGDTAGALRTAAQTARTEAARRRAERAKPGRGRGAGPSGHRAGRQSADLSLWYAFMEENLTEPLEGRWLAYGNALYWTNWELPDLSGITVARPGWFVGTFGKNRFAPSQALAMGLEMRQALRRLHLRSDGDEAIRYLRGETLQIGEDRIDRARPDVPAKGYCLVGIDGFPIGWGKWLGGMLKNEYPAGWRWT